MLRGDGIPRRNTISHKTEDCDKAQIPSAACARVREQVGLTLGGKPGHGSLAHFGPNVLGDGR